MKKVIIVGNLYVKNSLAYFLKKEGLLKEFIEESSRLNDWEDEEGSIDSIGQGFHWEESKRGHDFWKNLEQKYLTNS
jgi:hypothetical protein